MMLKTLVFSLAVVAVANAHILDDVMLESLPAQHTEVIDYVNSVGTTWRAGHNEYFKGANMKYAKDLCGTFIEETMDLAPLETDENGLEDLPTDFDARQNWSECKNVIGHVRDQASCGSCWAFGSTEAFNDRLCIATKGQFQTLLSTQHTTSCCNFLVGCMSMGCNGGQISGAWNYFVKHGVVTGGDYPDIGKGTTCWPYELPICSHHVSSKYPNCTGEGSTPKCLSSCSESKYSTGFKSDKHHASSSYSISGVQNIQKEIMTNGPVTAAFSVYSDFITYKTGVYQHVTGSMLGGHAIKILGWGEENGTPYWLVANSWNETWGDEGYFKILRGSNECGIESQVAAGAVKAN